MVEASIISNPNLERILNFTPISFGLTKGTLKLKTITLHAMPIPVLIEQRQRNVSMNILETAEYSCFSLYPKTRP